MSAVPAVTPITSPEDEPIVATPVVPLVQVPPVTGLESTDELPRHNANVPVIGGNAANTVSELTNKTSVRYSLFIKCGCYAK
jgi:hypothetical protein